MTKRDNSRSHSPPLRAIANLTNHDCQIYLYAAPLSILLPLMPIFRQMS
ncbi:hypothetical protein [Calothrix sp. NIES-2098]